jgi:hypothetical protein
MCGLADLPEQYRALYESAHVGPGLAMDTNLLCLTLERKQSEKTPPDARKESPAVSGA